MAVSSYGGVGGTRRKPPSLAPADEVMNRSGETIMPGVREMACRENPGATSFAKAAENLARTAQITLSGEQLRLVVEAEGRNVQAVHKRPCSGRPRAAADCQVVENGRQVPEQTRVYTPLRRRDGAAHQAS